jgi:hypothetical protein
VERIAPVRFCAGRRLAQEVEAGNQIGLGAERERLEEHFKPRVMRREHEVLCRCPERHEARSALKV